MKTKRAVEVVRDRPTHWVGDGFHVRTLLSYGGDARAASPFLLLDYAAPHPFAPAVRPRGVGEHPHRGFETVTVAYQGEVAHRDSSGGTGRLGPGDVQWMTAGSGIVHEEMHGQDFTRRGGTFEMVQFWVNLPARGKMSAPGYQQIAAAAIPTVELPDGAGTARVIAGELFGSKGPARTFTPIEAIDLRLRAGGAIDLPLPEGHTAALLVLRGRLRLEGAEPLGPAQLALFDREGDGLRLAADEDTTALLLAGEPIDEPVVGYGPFVMNTQAEILRAIRDFETGRFLSAS